ncbi:MAG: DUF616 domain-containing protein [Eubacteriales bacterium]|nr:DUF616 domain-containing protein [Eubacteriales bacterium]
MPQLSERDKLIIALEQLNKEKATLLSSPEYLKGTTLVNLGKDLKGLKFGTILRKFINRIHNKNREKRLRKKNFPGPKGAASPILPLRNIPPRIAVYTCVMGGYDDVAEPLHVPENCDFYLISDRVPHHESVYTYINPNAYYQCADNNSVTINRYFKIYPHLLFKDYEYSIYIDGNIRVISDPSRLIQKIGLTGIAMHRHYQRCCIYDEGEACIIYGKETRQKIKEQLDYYKEQGMPRQFGLYEANVIVRKHNETACINLMNGWWDQFCRFSKRDQLSFPYIVWKNGYQYEDIGLLGNNVRENYMFSFMDLHKK